jgi:predicted glycoside hydrolase/deacetylase ChbG (UPF0249 family)
VPIPPNIIVNADDIGLCSSVNQAILYSFQKGFINSTSLLTNMAGFDEAVTIIHNNPDVINVGVHVNFAEGRPLTNSFEKKFLTPDGSWNLTNINKVFMILNSRGRKAFKKELETQIEKALAAKVSVTHLDSHLHLHTLPAFYNLFINAAKKYKLKLRLAQTYNEGSYLKYTYRKYINSQIISAGKNYTDFFETVDKFLDTGDRVTDKRIEIMVHPDFKADGKFYDHVDQTSMDKWISFLAKQA